MAKKGMWPSPVYVGEFDDGTVARVSFWTQAGKPYDFEGGRRSLAIIYSRPEMAGDAPETRQARAASFYQTFEPRTVVDGHVEHDVPGEPWVRVRDPAFAAAAIPLKPPAKNVRRAVAKINDDMVQALVDVTALAGKITPDELIDIARRALAKAGVLEEREAA